MQYTVLIPAAGSSYRFKKNKLTLKINGEYLIKHTLSNFLEDSECTKIVLVVNLSQFDYFKSMFKLSSKILVVATNSLSRNETVQFGLQYCLKSEYIMIHDACRPYLTFDLIDRLKFELNQGLDAVIPAIEIVDSIVDFSNEQVNYLDRSKIKRIQTPQAFRTKVLLNAFELNSNHNFNDELSLLLQTNPSINYKLIPGEFRNLKITYPEDVNDIDYDLS